MTSLAEILGGAKRRGFGYSLADNLVGFDDGVNTPGERLGKGLKSLASALASDPAGMIGGALSGVKADLDNLMFEGGARERPQDVLGYAAAPMAPGAVSGALLRRTPNQVNVTPMLRGGSKAPATETGWTFRDVRKPKLSGNDNKRVQSAFDKVQWQEAELPINRMIATQSNVNPDFNTTTSSQDLMPTVVKKDGELFVRDGHHRLTKMAESGNSNAKVALIDLDQRTDAPLLDYDARANTFTGADQDLLDELFSDLEGDFGGPQLSPAQAEAQSVLDLLKTGRAGDVTDDMLAASDDMYLYNNYDLPMDEASRMARAEEMGFGGDMYHGSSASFDGFDPRALDATGQKVMAHGDGTYLSERPKSASRYAERRDGGVMYPVRENMNNPWTGEMSVADLSPQDAKIYMAAESGPEALGFSGRRNSLGMSVVPDPANIRSRFARFDPRLKHLSNLSAGVGGLSLASILNDNLDEETRAYLEGM